MPNEPFDDKHEARFSRAPQDVIERLARSLDLHPHPALESTRWARPGEGPSDPVAVAVAWDLVTQQAAAEANMLNRALRDLETEAERVLLGAMVGACARATAVGGLCVTSKNGQRWWPRDLAFIPGREHPTPELSLICGEAVDRVEFAVFLRHSHVGYVLGQEEQEPQEHRVERTLGVLLIERPLDERGPEDVRRDREVDLAMQSEGHIVKRLLVADLWRDPMGQAATLVEHLMETSRQDIRTLSRRTVG